MASSYEVLQGFFGELSDDWNDLSALDIAPRPQLSYQEQARAVFLPYTQPGTKSFVDVHLSATGASSNYWEAALSYKDKRSNSSKTPTPQSSA
ncbi:hypothetical protein CLAFUW4_07435 [Fulvia fulva]|uniref:Uncharacterized protein n=1 Tax=Passalora fulva TaxID=5499 RepID=A0A9Q8UR23_PASFU|nr:uncharacterized protein CLAFUR5_07565 [Fulvia fulva]KAK4622101.1 hypothetical protein CLAFUR4_07442 [Fulvia fulva]KAK4622739.1 hypothetical protein CLAFUR0_07441 [Fulvia fulva]UJO19271.1 hypothetical protein CLAFUR5_07565 [Fulvia fulva]WPV16108.1 hypothetical protein CLAFUW4_07435 [Fulvia fulva]WPV31519.1 hypothetical protein CLAFUW7_07438 [Fulvia fulva]